MIGSSFSQMGKQTYLMNLDIFEVALLRILLSVVSPYELKEVFETYYVRGLFSDLTDKEWDGVLHDLDQDYEAFRQTAISWCTKELPQDAMSQDFPYIP